MYATAALLEADSAIEAAEEAAEDAERETVRARLLKQAEEGLDGRPMCHYLAVFKDREWHEQLVRGRTRAEAMVGVFDYLQRRAGEVRYEGVMVEDIDFDCDTWETKFFNIRDKTGVLRIFKLDSDTYNTGSTSFESTDALPETQPLVKAAGREQ